MLYIVSQNRQNVGISGFHRTVTIWGAAISVQAQSCGSSILELVGVLFL